MIGRLAFRSLTAHPGPQCRARGRLRRRRCGDGHPARRRRHRPRAGAVARARRRRRRHIRSRLAVPARLVLSGTLQSDALRPRVRAAAASHTTDLFLLHNGRATRVAAQRRHPEPRASAGRSRESPASTRGATRERTLRGRRRRRKRCCARSIAFMACLMCPSGRTRGPSGCTSTAAPATRVSI